MQQIYIVRVDDIPPEGLSLATRWEDAFVEAVLEDDSQILEICSPLDLGFSFTQLGSKIILEGSCSGVLGLKCVRCLSRFSWPLEFRFRYILWPKPKEEPSEEKQLHQEDLEVLYYEGEHVDLRPLVREQVFLALPGYPRCREECRGLCPECGTDLNQNGCSCTPGGRSASPFSVLKDLKKKS